MKKEILDSLASYIMPLAEGESDISKKMAIYKLYGQVEDLISEIERLEYALNIMEEDSIMLSAILSQIYTSKLIRHSDGNIYYLVPTKEDTTMTNEEIIMHNNCISDISCYAQS